IALVGAFEMLGKGNVLNTSLAMPANHSLGHFSECLRSARTKIKNTLPVRVIEKPELRLADITDKNKITQLPAIVIAINAFKQPALALFADLLVKVPGHTGHTALVNFTRAVHIEIAETHYL